MFVSLQSSIRCLIISYSVSETRKRICLLRILFAICNHSFLIKIRGLGILPNKHFCIFAASENIKNLACVYTHAMLAILQIVEKTFFLQNCFSNNRNHSKRTIFQNEEIKKKRIYSIRKNPFLNFNNNSVVRVIQITESLQMYFMFFDVGRLRFIDYRLSLFAFSKHP